MGRSCCGQSSWLHPSASPDPMATPQAVLGAGLEDLTVANDRPVNVVAMEIPTWLGWLEG